MWREEILYERGSHLGGICPAFEEGEFCVRIQMYRTDFWTMWEKARVGYLERTTSKHVYYHG